MATPTYFQSARRALGSDVVLTFDSADTETIANDLWDQIERFEQRFSRFLPDSELSNINKSAGKDKTISRAFYDLLHCAIEQWQKTEGLYNPLLLPQLQQAGYLGSWPNVQKANASMDYRGRSQTDPSAIQLSRDTIRLPADSALDFGGIGKGYLLDQLGGYLEEHDVRNYWLSLGGDILCRGANEAGERWEIGIQSAVEPDKIIGTITAPDHGRWSIATSGTTKRSGKDWHHIIDPRTHTSAKTDLLTATVLAKTGVAADIAAKCLVILGSDKATTFAANHDVDIMVLQASKGQHKIGLIQWERS